MLLLFTIFFLNTHLNQSNLHKPENGAWDLWRVAGMCIFKLKIPIWVHIFWRALEWKMLVYFMAISNISQPFDISYGHLVHFVVNWYTLWSIGTFCGQLVHFVVNWYILWSIGTFCGQLVHFVVNWYILRSNGIFFTFWYVVQRKIWQP
jgi:hypothetical protein